MYDELVKMLRVCGDSNNSCGNCPVRENDGSCPHGEWEFAAEKYMLQAADAIEELSAYAKLYEELTDKGQKTARKLLDAYPRWISVEERLPEGEAGRYLVAAPLLSFGLWVSICYYADNLEEVDEYDFRNEKRGGFYGYDDEYGYYERSGVKYWMPLPEPPDHIREATKMPEPPKEEA